MGIDLITVFSLIVRRVTFDIGPLYSATYHMQARGRASKYTHNSFRIRAGVYPDTPYEDGGEMVFKCIYCKAMLFRDEIIQPGTLAQPSSHMCCAHGTVQLAPFKDAPPLLKSLLEGVHPLSDHFQHYIREFNSSLAMASNKYTLETIPGEMCVLCPTHVHDVNRTTTVHF